MYCRCLKATSIKNLRATSFSTAIVNGFGPLCASTSNSLHGDNSNKLNHVGESIASINTIGILGAGTMGVGIANVSIQNGYTTILKDINEKNLAKSQTRVEKYINKLVTGDKISKSDGEKCISLLIPTTDIQSFSKVDIVVEAVFEDLNIKHNAIKEIEEIVPDDCIIASNTSSIPITDIAKASKRSDKVVGMHYFSPVEKMKLLEIIKTKETSQETLKKCLEIASKQKKIPIIVQDGCGFYTTRVIMSYVTEGCRLILEGVDPERMDKLTKELGFPAGTTVLWDETGIDVTHHIYMQLLKAFPERFDIMSPKFAEELISNGILGRKTGKGAYSYEDKSKKIVNQDYLKIVEKHKIEPKMPLTDENIKSRIFSRTINEVALCLQDEIIFNPKDGDTGALLGLGIFASTKGPFRYIDTHGAHNIVSKMKEIEAFYGTSFSPCQLLQDHAKNPEKRFYKD